MGGRSRVNYRKISEISNGKSSRYAQEFPPKGGKAPPHEAISIIIIIKQISHDETPTARHLASYNHISYFEIGGRYQREREQGGGGSGSYFFAYFSTGRSFTGNIAKFIGLRFAMIFYASRPVVGAGPPMAGPSTSPHTFGPRGRGTEQASKEAEGERDVRHNLAIIPLFIPVRPLLSGHLNLLNTRRLVHFIKPRVCTRTIHFHLALVSSYPFPSSFFFFSLLFREGTPFFLSLARRRVGEQGTPQDVESLTRFHGNGRESNKRPRPRDTSIRCIKLDVMIVATIVNH